MLMILVSQLPSGSFNVTGNAISDFLTIENTSGGDCCTAKYHYCLYNNTGGPTLAYERDNFYLKSSHSQTDNTDQRFSLYIVNVLLFLHY